MVDYNTANIHKRVSLPKDISPHSLTDVEWWYYFAFLNGEHGGKYAAMGAFYQAGELPILKGHYLIQDKLPAPHQWLSHASIEKAPTRLLYDNSSMIFKDNKAGHFQVTVSSNGTETNLVFNSLKPVSLIGETGKPDNLYYYSFPRNKVKGYIKKKYSTEYVSGEGWFDHQWGYRENLITKTGWNWFGLQLEDGRELLINEFRTIKTGDTFSPMANLIEQNGKLKFTRNLTLQPSNYWQSPLTNAVYPLNWIVTIPEFNMTINISAVFKEQEMPVIAPLNAILEGVCSVSGKETKPNRRSIPLSGKGFLELVGYANYNC